MAARPHPRTTRGTDGDSGIRPRTLSPAASRFYESVFDATRKGVLGELRRRGCSQEEAEEFFAMALEKVMRNVDPVARGFSKPEMVNFLKRAAWRVMIDERRRRHPEVELSEVGSLTDAGAVGPEEVAVDREAVAIGREALHALSERDRLIFRQRHELGLSPEEILERTPGLSMRTYRKLIGRANERVLTAFQAIEGGRRCEELGSGVLARYVADGCEIEEQRAVEVHLAHCRACQLTLARMRGYLHEVAGGLAVMATGTAGARVHASWAAEGAARLLDAGQGLVAGTKSLLERLRELAFRAAGSVPGSGGDAAAGQLIGASTAKLAAGCLAGAAATTAACVALGVSPLAVVGVTHEAPSAPRPAEQRRPHRVVTPPPVNFRESSESAAAAQPAPPSSDRKNSAKSSTGEKSRKPEPVHRAAAEGGELVEGLEGAGRTPRTESAPPPESTGEAAGSSSSAPAPSSSGSSGGGSGGGAAPVDGGAELGL
jgi:DNA-directed RNA polymerase specialized sigma24 family protein